MAGRAGVVGDAVEGHVAAVLVHAAEFLPVFAGEDDQAVVERELRGVGGGE